MIIGITGGIATGKSTFSNLLKTYGFKVVDADKISYEALTIDRNCIQKVVSMFNCQNEDGTINRQKLGEIIFNDQTCQKKLESIVHPYVINKIENEIKASKEQYIFLDIPLLYEANLQYLCDCVIVVYANYTTQLERLKKRNNLTDTEAICRIQSQLDIEIKKQKANYIIDNNGDLENLKYQTNKLIEQLNNGGI